jgi:hypothetical protein
VAPQSGGSGRSPVRLSVRRDPDPTWESTLRILILALLAITSLAPSSRADIAFYELTSENLDSCHYDISVRTRESRDRIRFWVRITQRNGEPFDLANCNIGGGVDICQPNRFPRREMQVWGDDVALIFSFSVSEKSLSDHCFSFWKIGPYMPGGSLYWFNLGSPPEAPR